MAQFKVHRNLKSPRNPNIPYLLDIQHAILEGLDSRLVVPLLRSASVPRGMERLHLAVKVRGEAFVLSVPEMGAVPVKRLGAEVGDLSAHRQEVQLALDFLFSGY